MRRDNGEVLGKNLMLVTKRLLNNQNLCKLLTYEDKDPLANELINKPVKLLNTRILVIPRKGIQEEAESKLVVMYSDGDINGENGSYKDVILSIHIYVPLDQWRINDDNFRPFLIMHEIQNSLIGTQYFGMGTIQGGDFHLDMITEDMSTYIMTFLFINNA